MAKLGTDGIFPTYSREEVEPAETLYSDGVFPVLGFESPSPVVPASEFIAEVLINGTVVWSASADLWQDTVEIDVSEYYGILPLTFRIRGV